MMVVLVEILGSLGSSVPPVHKVASYSQEEVEEQLFDHNDHKIPELVLVELVEILDILAEFQNSLEVAAADVLVLEPWPKVG